MSRAGADQPFCQGGGVWGFDPVADPGFSKNHAVLLLFFLTWPPKGGGGGVKPLKPPPPPSIRPAEDSVADPGWGGGGTQGARAKKIC